MPVPDETQILAHEDQPAGNWQTNSRGYQMLLVFLLSLNFGIVFFDRQALGALMPFIQPEFGLSGLQIGFLASGLSFSWAIAAFFVGGLSDSIGKRKILLVLATAAFSLCSVVSGLATGFLFLFGARLLMGAAEGGVMPISHAMVASEVDPKHRGLAQGVAQNLGSNLLGSFAAPALLTWVAVAYGWRNAFYFAAIPGLLSALLIWFLLVEPANLQRAEKQKKRFGQVASEWWDATSAAMKVRNMWICVVVGVLMVAHFVITWTFLQTFLIQQRGMAEIPAGILMSSLGIAAAIYSFVVSGLSDRIGRKPVMVFLPFLSLVGPLGVLFLDPAAFTGEGMFGLSAYATVLIPIFFIGWMVNGTFPIFMATIPSETFKPIHHATVLGLAMGFCEVLGGVFGPPIAGALNDAFGMETFLYVLMILAVISGIVATGLVETAPAVLRRRGQVYATA
jgi:MFS transporter, ACS family, hexuronate transporter